MYLLSGQASKNTLTFLKSNKKNIFKRLFNLKKRGGTHEGRMDRKSTER